MEIKKYNRKFYISKMGYFSISELSDMPLENLTGDPDTVLDACLQVLQHREMGKKHDTKQLSRIIRAGGFTRVINGMS